jgi:hypothetical protein
MLFSSFIWFNHNNNNNNNKINLSMELTMKLKGRIKYYVHNLNKELIFASNWIKNINPAVGKTAILRRMGNIGSVANEGIITYGAVGDGSSIPAVTDTAMLNELGRTAIATSSVAAGILTIETFFNSATGNGSLTQFALFGEDAGAGSGSGTMFQYTNFDATVTKTSAETLTVISEFTFS